jgi:hypothetical protein
VVIAGLSSVATKLGEWLVEEIKQVMGREKHEKRE